MTKPRASGWSLLSPAFFLCLVCACGSVSNFKSHLITPPDTARLESPGDTFIVLGGRLPSEGSSLTAATFMLYANGNRQPPKGVAVAGVYKGEIGTFAGGSSIHDNTTYVETDAGRHAYRIWRIPGDQITAGAPLRVFLFIASIRSGSNIWAPFKMNQWPVPSKPRPIEWSQSNPENYFFNGAVLDITSPGVYYLGDVELSGFVSDKTENSVRTVLAGSNVVMRPNPAAAHAFFSRQSGLPSFPYFDASMAWQKFPGSEHSTFLDGKVPSGWRPSMAAPPGTGAPAPAPVPPPAPAR